MVGWDPPQAQPGRRAALPAQQRKAGPDLRGFSAQKASLSSGNHGRRRACIPPAAGLFRKRVKWSQRNVALRPSPTPPTPRLQSPRDAPVGKGGPGKRLRDSQGREASPGASGSLFAAYQGKGLRAQPGTSPPSRPTSAASLASPQRRPPPPPSLEPGSPRVCPGSCSAAAWKERAFEASVRRPGGQSRGALPAASRGRGRGGARSPNRAAGGALAGRRDAGRGLREALPSCHPRGPLGSAPSLPLSVTVSCARPVPLPGVLDPPHRPSWRKRLQAACRASETLLRVRPPLQQARRSERTWRPPSRARPPPRAPVSNRKSDSPLTCLAGPGRRRQTLPTPPSPPPPGAAPGRSKCPAARRAGDESPARPGRAKWPLDGAPASLGGRQDAGLR